MHAGPCVSITDRRVVLCFIHTHPITQQIDGPSSSSSVPRIAVHLDHAHEAPAIEVSEPTPTHTPA